MVITQISYIVTFSFKKKNWRNNKAPKDLFMW